ncbi:hypothetical protein AMJ49_06215, partial [Parcubacteria bacterium DG_74_2]
MWKIKQSIKNLVKPCFNRIVEKDYRSYQPILRAFKDIHKGERCFIIGTGPSLNKTDLSLIKDEIIFGVNTLYKGLDKFNIGCNYYALSDPVVWKNYAENILNLNSVVFLSSGAAQRYLFKKKFLRKFRDKKPILIKTLSFEMWSSGSFSKDLSLGVYGGDTIIIDICLQAAYYMGFKKVYLLGCDCDYSGFHRFD